jgi:N-acetylmuramoyl-L-alanine amidase
MHRGIKERKQDLILKNIERKIVKHRKKHGEKEMKNKEESFYGQNIREAYETLKNMFKGRYNMKCGLIVGHKPNRPGACNKKHKICEYQFNDQLACDIYDYLKSNKSDIGIQIIRRKTYRGLPDDVNLLEPDFCISMHCNAAHPDYTGKWNGTETLYYHKSKMGKIMAEIVQKNIVKVLEFRDRGILPRKTEDRGGYLLRYTSMPCVIAEPFFIDNNSAYKTVMERYDKLVQAYANSIEEIAKMI